MEQQFLHDWRLEILTAGSSGYVVDLRPVWRRCRKRSSETTLRHWLQNGWRSRRRWVQKRCDIGRRLMLDSIISIEVCCCCFFLDAVLDEPNLFYDSKNKGKKNFGRNLSWRCLLEILSTPLKFSNSFISEYIDEKMQLCNWRVDSGQFFTWCSLIHA